MDGFFHMGGEGGSSDLFDMLGGGGLGGLGGGLFSPFGGGMRRRPRKGQSTIQPLPVSLEDLYKGKMTKLQLTKKVLCKTCNGVGGKAGCVVKCTRCRGSGTVFITRQIGPGMIQQMSSRCDECAGEGEIINERDRCKKCSGRKTVQEQKIIEVNITPGMHDEQKIVLHGEGDQEPGIEPGDVVLVIKTKPHEKFERKGNDLFLKQEKSLKQALCGFSLVVEHLDGRELILSVSPGEVIKPNSIRGAMGEGMPFPNSFQQRGNLYVLFEIKFPENYFLEANLYPKLESLLPPKPTQPNLINSEHRLIEDVSLGDFEPRRYQHAHASTSTSREAYQEDDSSDEDMNMGGGFPGMGGGGQRVQCAQQ